MKITPAQLRKLILSEVRKARLSEAAESVDVSETTADFVTGALTMWLDETGVDLLTNNAFEMLQGTLREDELPIPARIEDIDGFADSAAEKVLSDPQVHEHVKAICKLVIESVMENS